ncbi:MAG: hypothetical protein SFV19_20270 [Rhodospirillaceae bacterium]|nr:hypothetical protein [Rhodospirillaceae bacterium]
MTITRRDGLILASTAALTAKETMSAAAASETPMTTPTVKSVTPALFDAWIRMRGGEDGPAYWYSEGLVRSMLDGSVDSRMLGVETWITPKELRTPTSAVSISRKVYFFMARDQDAMMLDQATGKPRRPSIFAYQVRTFTLIDGKIDYKVESHDTRGTRMGGDGSVYTVNAMGDYVHVNYAVFPKRPGTTGGSGEVYDYFDHGPRIAEMPQRYQGTWTGGSTSGQLSNMAHWRYPTFDAMPNEWLKARIRKDGPMWMEPPKTMAEIEKLRPTSVTTALIPA